MFDSAIWFSGEGSRSDGEWIFPAPASVLRPYDLLSELPRGMSNALGRECAVTRLLTLVFEVKPPLLEFTPREGHDEGMIEDILAFVDRYGLFGGLQQTAIEIHGRKGGWRRENGRWLGSGAGEPGATFGPSYFRPKSRRCGLASLEEDYFPLGFPKGELPSPSSKEFLGLPYAEKVGDWWLTAELLGDAFTRLDRRMLDGWLSVAGLGLTEPPATLNYQSNFPSLICGLVAQYVNAIRDGFHIQVCENETCPRARVFFGVGRSRFCSPHCGNSQRQRERRNKALEKMYHPKKKSLPKLKE